MMGQKLTIEKTPLSPDVVVEQRAPFASCIGCGFCCIKSPCPLVEVIGKWTGCPHLMFFHGRHWCEPIVIREMIQHINPEYKPTLDIHDILAIGEGCCCSMNTWRREPLRDRRKI